MLDRATRPASLSLRAFFIPLAFLIIFLAAAWAAPAHAAPGDVVWHSHNVVIENSSRQASVADTSGANPATLAIYQSTASSPRDQAASLSIFRPGPHTQSFNLLSAHWTLDGPYGHYPYAGKSSVRRGSGAGESGAPSPLGVSDLQLHPPASGGLIVAAFTAPRAGAYSLSGLAARRVLSWGDPSSFNVFRPNGSLVTQVRTSSRAWATDSRVYDLGTLAAGERIYFAVDRGGSFDGDATEVAWTLTLREGSAPASEPAPAPPPSSSGKLIFGLGPTANTARDSRLNREAPLGMLTTWYNGPRDLDWMRHWEGSLIPQAYASGRALHLIVYDGGPEGGTPCGRQYAIGSQINDDMVRLAQIWGGRASDPPLYVTLFTEFQTYPCRDNQWAGAEAYYRRLQAKAIEIRDIFRTHAPNARVSLGWGGWQHRWDGPSTGAGRSLFPYFSDTMRAMDFQSFQAMQGDGNVEDARQMTRILGAYGPVMLAHYKPDGFHPDVFERDLRTMFTDSYIAELTSRGLFAFSFMDQREISSSESIFILARDGIRRYGRAP